MAMRDDADIEKYLRNIRDTEMPAMNNALGLLGSIEFAQQATLVPESDGLFKTHDRAAEGIWAGAPPSACPSLPRIPSAARSSS